MDGADRTSIAEKLTESTVPSLLAASAKRAANQILDNQQHPIMTQDTSNENKKKSSSLSSIRHFKTLFWPILVAGLSLAVINSGPVRTLRSLRRVVPHNVEASNNKKHSRTNTFVMDYYADYKLDKIRYNGIRSIRQIEDSFLEVWFPAPIAWIAKRIKRLFLPPDLHRDDDDDDAHHCSSLMMQSKNGDAVYFGRNFDWFHDTTLILRVHDGRNKKKSGNPDDDLASIAVLDLHYLNFNRPDLENTNIIERIPLLFAPYYVMDGMNRHGLAISDHVIPQAVPPANPNKPKIIHSTLARVVLDYAKTVEEAVDIIDEFQIHFPYAQIHFMLADASGHSKIVEFIDGHTRLSNSTQLESSSWQLCTNTIVWDKSEEEQDYLCPRYRLGSQLAQDLSGQVVTKDDAIRVTRSMVTEGYTMWTSIYELKEGKYWHFYKTNPNLVHSDRIPLHDPPTSMASPVGDEL